MATWSWSSADVTWDDPEIGQAAVAGRVRRLDPLSMASEAANWNPFPESVESWRHRGGLPCVAD